MFRKNSFADAMRCKTLVAARRLNGSKAVRVQNGTQVLTHHRLVIDNEDNTKPHLRPVWMGRTPVTIL